MKNLIFISAFLILNIQVKSQSYEIISQAEVVGRDTINKISSQNFKEGIWVIRGKHYPKLKYPMEQVIETGHYLYNRKSGLWFEYYPNGKQRSKLTYVNGVLDGPATFFDTNGNAIQEGKFKDNKWVR